MERRELLGVLGVTAASLTAFAGRASANATHEKEMATDSHAKCAEACTDCAKHCNEGFHHAYMKLTSGKADYAKAMHLCVDCGEICATSAKLVARKSPLMVHTCDACAECCEDTLAACKKLDDPEMKDVITALETCMMSCKEMVKAMGGHTH